MKKSSSMQSHNQQWSEYLRCISCEKAFNRSDRCPVSLVCGHTVCKSCIKKNMHSMCPSNSSANSTCNVSHLPINSALLQLVPDDSGKAKDTPISSNSVIHDNVESCPSNFGQYLKYYEDAKLKIEDLALYLKPSNTNDLTRPMQRKLVLLVGCQLVEEDGRRRAIRVARTLGERTATELILLHQNPSTLSANLWTAVRGRGCQFLGPAMQEEALKLIHLALEDMSELSRKVLVQLVVKNLQCQFTQASKTSIGHVVQLLYRASCFKVTKREGESSLMRLKDEFLHYDDLRKEHDTQIVQIAREAGLRIAPDQWSALLYGDQVHKSYMQSIIDKLQSGVTFQQCIQDLSLAVQSSGDPGNIQSILPLFKYLSDIDAESPPSDWMALAECMHSVTEVIHQLVNFNKQHHHSMWQNQDMNQQSSKYKTSLCRDFKNKGICPRGAACTFAHSDHELQFHRNRRKKGGQSIYRQTVSIDSQQSSIPENDPSDNGDYSYSPQSSITSAKLSGNPMCICSNSPVQTFPHPRASNLLSHQATSRDVAHVTYSTAPAPVKVNPNHNPIQNIYPKQGQVHTVLHPSNPAVGSHQHSSSVSLQQVIAIAPPSQTNQLQYRQVNTMLPDSSVTVMPSDRQPPQQQHLPHEQHQHQQQAFYSPNYPPGTVHIMHDPANPSLNPHMSQTIVQQHYSPAQPHPPPPPPPNYVQGNTGQQMVATTPQNQYIAQHYIPVQPMQHGYVPPPPPPPIERVVPQAVMIPQPLSVPVNTGDIVTNIANPGTNYYMNNQPNAGVFIEPLHQIHQPEYRVNVTIAHKEVASPVEVPQLNYSINHAQAASPTPVLSLEELRQRKLEVINKLVQKRIVTPISTAAQQWVTITQSGQSREESRNVKVPDHASVYTPAPVAVSVPVGHNYLQASSTPGSYSLWTGTTCLSSLHGLSNISLSQPDSTQFSSIDVRSDLDSTTSQVSSNDRLNMDIFARSSQAISNSSLSISEYLKTFVTMEDDFYPIQDQRIVSKFGPIARNVRSRTIPALPEQVTANANSFTQPFASDKSRLQSKFLVSQHDQSQMACVCTEVEPTVEEKPTSLHSIYSLPDIIATSSSGQNVLSTAEMLSLSLPGDRHNEIQEEAEDLLLAIELQQIEMGIQQKLILEKKNRP